MKVGLTIGGGGAKGYAAIPIIEYIRKKVNIDYISGCSIGSILGAYLAIHGELNSLYELTKGMSKKDWIKLIDFNNPKHSLIKGHKIKSFLNDLFEDKSFEDLKIPLVIVATNLSKNKVVYFDSGKLIDAVMASISIPGIFKPYKIGKDYYVDGGVKENLPYNVLLDRGMDKVIAISLNIESNSKIDYNSMLDVILNVYYTFLQTTEVPTNDKVFLFQPRFKRHLCESFKFYKIEENYSAGLKELNKRKKEFLNWLKK